MGSRSMKKIFIFQPKIKTLSTLDDATTYKLSKVKDKIKEW